MNAETSRISITIAIKGHCREYFPEVPEFFEHKAESGQTLRQILVELGINPQLIMGTLVNGKMQKKDYQPAEGDKIILLSPPTGGN